MKGNEWITTTDFSLSPNTQRRAAIFTGCFFPSTCRVVITDRKPLVAEGSAAPSGAFFQAVVRQLCVFAVPFRAGNDFCSSYEYTHEGQKCYAKDKIIKTESAAAKTDSSKTETGRKSRASCRTGALLCL